MMMSPTALIDTAGAGALLGAPGEVDNGAPDVEGGVRPVAADVPLCPPAGVHAAVSSVRVSSTDTRRRRDGRFRNAERRAASLLILWALVDGGDRHGSGQKMRRLVLPAPTHLRHPVSAARARPRAPNDRALPSTAVAPSMSSPNSPAETSGSRPQAE